MTKLITTTLPYANSLPHIGHSLEFILGDCLSRYWKNKIGKDKVYFNVGLDEHGQKIQEAAKSAGVSPESYVDTIGLLWYQFCDKLNIDYDGFYHTSSEEHKEKVSNYWIKCLNNGHIYKKSYTSKYCVGCESFKTEKDLVDGKCPDHLNLDVQDVSEENYFFRLSDQTDALLKWLEDSPDFLYPKSKREELTNLLKDVEDISISRLRSNLTWGIPVPNDNEQTIYVWFEALLNYIFANGWDGDCIQLCGPDNLRFQAVIFQGILKANDLPNTQTLLVHGTILDEDGKKMSKTQGNVIDPIDQVEKFGIDAVRWYSVGGFSNYSNARWSEGLLVEFYNSNLADGLGNLLARTLHLIDKYDIDVKSVVYVDFPYSDLDNAYEDNDLRGVCSLLNEEVGKLNRFINTEEPWKVDSHNRNEVLCEIYWKLRGLTYYYDPIIPNKCAEIRKALQEKKKAIIFPKLEVD